ncbi:MAG: hypothetical protein Q6373_018325 [Candidatus Sigynarchaeota archaeon]
MGIAITCAIYVDESNFLPTRLDLINIALVLCEAKIIDDYEKSRLIKNIVSERYDLKDRIEFKEREEVTFEYHVKKLLWFHGISEETAMHLDLHKMTIRANKLLADEDHGTLFTIASQLCLPPVDIDGALLQLRQIQRDPQMVNLLSQLSKAIGKSIKIGIFFHV